MAPDLVELTATILAVATADAREHLAARIIDKLMDFDEIESAALSFGGSIIGGSKSDIPPFVVMEPDEGQA